MNDPEEIEAFLDGLDLHPWQREIAYRVLTAPQDAEIVIQLPPMGPR